MADMEKEAEIPFPYEPLHVVADVMRSLKESSDRCLFNTEGWLSELRFALIQCEGIRNANIPLAFPADMQMTPEENARYMMVKSLFNLKKYAQCAFHAKECKSPAGKFLHYYSRFLACDIDYSENEGDENKNKYEGYVKLHRELEEERTSGNRDSYILYLLGAVLRKLNLSSAVDILRESLVSNPLNWAAWMELSTLVTSQEMLESLSAPECWMKHFFFGHVYIELHCGVKALNYYESLNKGIFKQSLYVQTQIARAYFNLRDSVRSNEIFADVRKQDPHRLDNMDVFSNVLYVLSDLKGLAVLANEANATEKYCVETCCIIANYYSLRRQHEKAILYLQRALKLDPRSSHPWTIMGHEHIEIKNTNAAIACYRKAIELNARDFRPWYGLGQAYELLKMPLYSLYYYRRAQIINPHDSRMLIALGDAYEKLERMSDAKKCYWKAHCVGDAENIGRLRLAKLYDRLRETDLAAAAYMDILREEQHQDIALPNHAEAYVFLANYHLQKGKMDEAYFFAQKCVEIPRCINEGKAILKEIAHLRPKQDLLEKPDVDQTFPARKISIDDESMSMAYTP